MTKTHTNGVETMIATRYFTNDTGQIFRVAKSSHPGLLHVSLNTGSCDFLGYAENINSAVAIITCRFGGGVRRLA